MSSRRPWITIGVAGAAFLLALPLAADAPDVLVPYAGDLVPGSESARVRDQIEETTGLDLTGGVLAVVRIPNPRDTAWHTIGKVRAIFAQSADIGKVVVPGRDLSPADPLISRGGDHALVIGYLKPLSDNESAKAGARLERSIAAVPGVDLGGTGVGFNQGTDEVTEGLKRAELFAVPAVMLLAFVFFRGLVAALVPGLIAVLSIVWSGAALRLVGGLTEISVFALNIVTALALALAIDFGILIVARYREELARHGAGGRALERAMLTSGRTVYFSSLTVGLVLLSLFVFPQRFLISMAIGGALVAAITCLQAFLVLPAALALLGESINSLSPRFLQRTADREAQPLESGMWYRLSRWVVRRAVVVAPISLLILLALAVPFLSVEMTRSGADILPHSRSAKRVDETVKAKYPPNLTTPAIVLVHSRVAPSEVRRDLLEVPGLEAALKPERLTDDEWLLKAFPRDSTFSASAQGTIRKLRSESRNGAFEVGGETAAFVDQQDSLATGLPLALLIVAAAAFAFILLATRAPVLATKAVILNFLSVLATLGVTVGIVRSETLGDLLGFQSFGLFVDPATLVFISVMAFALSTDYGIIVLSRIREERDGGRTDREAISAGMERTGRLVSAAALLFAIAFAATVTGDMILAKEVGIGLAAAALIDSLLVRTFLLPSTMALLGIWNWWLPGFAHRETTRTGG